MTEYWRKRRSPCRVTENGSGMKHWGCRRQCKSDGTQFSPFPVTVTVSKQQNKIKTGNQQKQHTHTHTHTHTKEGACHSAADGTSPQSPRTGYKWGGTPDKRCILPRDHSPIQTTYCETLPFGFPQKWTIHTRCLQWVCCTSIVVMRNCMLFEGHVWVCWCVCLMLYYYSIVLLLYYPKMIH